MDKLGKLITDGSSVVSCYYNSIVLGVVVKSVPSGVRLRLYTKSKQHKNRRVSDPNAAGGFRWVSDMVPFTIIRRGSNIVVIDDPDVLMYALRNT